MARQVAGNVVRLEGVDEQPSMYSIDLDTGYVGLYYNGWVNTGESPLTLTVDDKVFVLENITHDSSYWEDTVIDGNIAKGESV